MLWLQSCWYDAFFMCNYAILRIFSCIQKGCVTVRKWQQYFTITPMVCTANSTSSFFLAHSAAVIHLFYPFFCKEQGSHSRAYLLVEIVLFLLIHNVLLIFTSSRPRSASLCFSSYSMLLTYSACPVLNDLDPTLCPWYRPLVDLTSPKLLLAN